LKRWPWPICASFCCMHCVGGGRLRPHARRRRSCVMVALVSTPCMP
jgi:hypothetical protein